MNFRLTSLLTVLSLCFACAEYAEPSLYEIGSEKKTNKDAIQKKIVNGSLDTVHGAVVAVIGDVTCTGTIITPTVVLTAAHCIGESGQFYNPREVWVTNAFDQQPVEGAAITRYAIHPNWLRSEDPAGDVALVLLDRPLRTPAMPLHLGSVENLRDETIQAVGFGVTNGWAQTGGGEKRATTMVIKDTFSGGFNAESPGGRQTDTCQGDSGGPAIVTINRIEYVIGVVSSGPEGCTGLTHYSALTDKASWIADVIGQGTPTTPPSANSASSSQQSAQAEPPVCPYTNDGECDEPTYCAYGTDTADCEAAAQAASRQAASASSQSQSSATPSAPGPDSCRYAHDGVCDEPTYCEYGTDTTDCSMPTTAWDSGSPSAASSSASASQPSASEPAPSQTATETGPNSCRWANDGECDEPTYCAFGTDTADCQAAQTQAAAPVDASNGGFGDSCRYANDGVCDEPTYCDFGTDQTDCAAQAAATPPLPASSESSVPYSASCRWANDGVCDEPTYCDYGTDGNDCD